MDSETEEIKGWYVKAFVNNQVINTPVDDMKQGLELFAKSRFTPGCDAVYLYHDGHIFHEYAWADSYDLAMQAKEEQDEEDRRDGLVW